MRGCIDEQAARSDARRELEAMALHQKQWVELRVRSLGADVVVVVNVRIKIRAADQSARHGRRI